MGWLVTTRGILELLYFASGIAIAVFAFLGLRQVKLGLEQLQITKEIARTNAKRESVKFASDQCRYFAETAMPLMCMSAIFQIRKMNIARYESSMKLFVLWNNRLEAEAAAPAMKALGELKKAAEERIKPLDHNF
ncbi:MAG: hypothetical protein WAN65_25905 [Candidatus Sulfotelmatobacter sp.]